jgi:hypothetical protein
LGQGGQAAWDLIDLWPLRSAFAETTSDYAVVTNVEQKPRLEIGGRCLAFFVDDTGHKAFKANLSMDSGVVRPWGAISIA